MSKAFPRGDFEMLESPFVDGDDDNPRDKAIPVVGVAGNDATCVKKSGMSTSLAAPKEVKMVMERSIFRQEKISVRPSPIVSDVRETVLLHVDDDSDGSYFLSCSKTVCT